MNKFSENLIASFGRKLAIIKTAKTISYGRQIAFILSLTVVPIVVQAAAYQTYVIHTYGGDALLPSVRQQLNASRDGGTVSIYQDKLVLRTTASNYQVVQKLLAQIDRQPQALTVAVRVGNNSSAQGNIQQGQVTISNSGIQGVGIINQSNSQQQTNNLYQVQTLSGSAASISTGTLYALDQNYTANSYPTYPSYNRPVGRIIIQQLLLPTSQGIAVTPRLLANGQVEVQLTQIEEKLVRANPSYNRYGYNSSVQGQRLNSTIIVPRGQWVTIGQISQNSQNQTAGYGGNQNNSRSNDVPISLLLQ
ncbi:hypothetical protein FQ082_05300 [Psychrobacter sp. ANT_H56B]|uniref:hypothetical protein n=1 Tax=Psychrobacter sp. ANT_H56B TaxID=2597353 RepID=UPI0011F179DD|nr:hypothetical protein [Psychrobacter sp. ANT_H56B]KAA0927263.1 hypothetical protein FQ082_05300 [Psychrobacter sp. ANT_H56B]